MAGIMKRVLYKSDDSFLTFIFISYAPWIGPCFWIHLWLLIIVFSTVSCISLQPNNLIKWKTVSFWNGRNEDFLYLMHLILSDWKRLMKHRSPTLKMSSTIWWSIILEFRLVQLLISQFISTCRIHPWWRTVCLWFHCTWAFSCCSISKHWKALLYKDILQSLPELR